MKNKVGVLIITYNRVDDARINMEIIRSIWPSVLGHTPIVHSYNGDPAWYPKPYLEDKLLRCKNPGHYEGATALIDRGVRAFRELEDCRYLVVVSADTWLVKPTYIKNTIAAMSSESYFLAGAVWGNPKHNDLWRDGLALDFFIADLEWCEQYGLFPLRYKAFRDSYWEVLMYSIMHEAVSPERLFAVRFLQAIIRFIKSNHMVCTDSRLKEAAEMYIYRMKDRELIHGARGIRRMYWPRIGLITHHEPEAKQRILRRVHGLQGSHSEQLLKATNLSYYNGGAGKHHFKKGDTVRVFGE